jgi:hypothetical protein
MSRHLHTQQSPRTTLGLIVLLLGLFVALSAALLAPLASAATVDEGSLSMTSDEGDFVGQGQPRSFDSDSGDVFNVTTTAGSVNGSIQTADGNWWQMNFGAPQGETLAVGTYDGATRFWFREPSEPGLDISGEGRGCSTITGSFTVTEITFDDTGAVQTFDADFVQHCEGAEPALRGHVHLVNAPPPPPLTIAIGLADAGSVDRASGAATVRGTITCNTPTTVFLTGRLTQRVTRFAQATASFFRQVACDGTTSWEATVRSENTVPFAPGIAQLSTDAMAFGDGANQSSADSESATVRLTR